MVSPHRYSSHALILLAMLFVTGCFAAASVMSLAQEKTDFPFHARPTELLAQLSKLPVVAAQEKPADETIQRSTAASAREGRLPNLPEDVIQLLKRTERGEVLEDRDLVEAYLIASGVFDRRQCDAYVMRLESIVASAKTATSAANSPLERGELLLAFLHSGPMKAGYDAKQTRLSVLLDTGKFNCVSATALYQIVAARLGLNVQALSIPSAVEGHAMSMFLDGGSRLDVETTNPDGFNFRSKVKESGATVIGIQLDPEKGHDISPQGLASLIAQNLAAGASRDQQPLAAVQAALIGLALDPRENAKGNNFVAAVNDWAMRLGDESKFEQALRVMQLGLTLLPADETLVNNADLLWRRYAVHQAKAGRGAQAVAVVNRATKAGRLKRPDEALAAPFISVADDFCDQKKWPEAIVVLDQGLAVIEGDAAAELRKWLVQVHTRWAQAEQMRGDYDAAIAALAALRKRATDDGKAQNAIAYFAQECLAEVERAGGPEPAAKLLVKLREQFSGIEYLNEAGVVCARRALEKLISANRFADAATAIDRYRPLLTDDAARDDIGGFVFDSWGRELVRKKDWQQATKVYGDGLKKYPASELLKNNVVVAWDSWAAQSVQEKDWREAIRIYELALKTLGENSHLRQNLDFCKSKL